MAVKLEAVKMVLKALSMSNPMGVPLSVLLDDYKLIKGHPLPYAAFGYTSPENFLSDLSYMIEIRVCNGHKYVYPIVAPNYAKIKPLMLKDATKAMHNHASFPGSHGPPQSKAPISRSFSASHTAGECMFRPLHGNARVPPPVPPRKRAAVPSSASQARASSTCAVITYNNNQSQLKLSTPAIVASPDNESVHINTNNPFDALTSSTKLPWPPIPSNFSAFARATVHSTAVGISTPQMRSQSLNPFLMDDEDPAPVPQQHTVNGRTAMCTTPTILQSHQIRVDSPAFVFSCSNGGKQSHQPIAGTNVDDNLDQTQPIALVPDRPFNHRCASDVLIRANTPQEAVVREAQSKHNEIPKYDAVASETAASTAGVIATGIASQSSQSSKPLISSRSMETIKQKALPKIREDHTMFWPRHTEIAPQGTKFVRKMPAEYKQHAIIRLYVTEVNNPYKFWFNYSKTADDLKKLMAHMDTAYNQLDADEFIVIERFVRKGQICAAFYMKKWHRAEIVDVYPKEEQVKVFFVDYGTVDEVDTQNIRFLKKDFVTLPAQAYRGVIDGIKPIQGIWMRDDTIYLQQQVLDRPLCGSVTHVNAQENVVHMILTDPNYNNDSSVNDQMLANEHARVTSHLHTLPKRLYAEVYPSFEALENGIYPSFAEVGELKENGFDLENYEGSIIVPEMLGYSSI